MHGAAFLRIDSVYLVSEGDASIFTLDNQGYLRHGGLHVALQPLEPRGKLIAQSARDARSLRLESNVGINTLVFMGGTRAVDIYNPSSPNLKSWTSTGRPNQRFERSAAASTSELVITTFNALLDGFEEVANSPWSTRRAKCATKLKSRNSDIILWNEVNASMMEDMRAAGVLTRYIIGDKGSSSGIPMQCAMSWHGSGIEILNIEEPLTTRQRCLVVTARIAERTVVLVATHLTAGESDEREEARIDQMRHIIEHLRDIEADAFVIAGDFNSDTSLAHMYTSRLHNYLGDEGFTNLTGFRTTYHGWGPCQFDYIYGLGLCATGAPVVDPMPSRAPNADQGSDHTPVTVGLDFVTATIPTT